MYTKLYSILNNSSYYHGPLGLSLITIKQCANVLEYIRIQHDVVREYTSSYQCFGLTYIVVTSYCITELLQTSIWMISQATDHMIGCYPCQQEAVVIYNVLHWTFYQNVLYLPDDCYHHKHESVSEIMFISFYNRTNVFFLHNITGKSDLRDTAWMEHSIALSSSFLSNWLIHSTIRVTETLCLYCLVGGVKSGSILDMFFIYTLFY